MDSNKSNGSRREEDETALSWKNKGQPWRTQPACQNDWHVRRLEQYVDVFNGYYPFSKNSIGERKLSRAEIEDLLARHKDGEWLDSTARSGHAVFVTDGLDLRGADLTGLDLSRLPLWETRGGLEYRLWKDADGPRRQAAAADFSGSYLWRTRMERSSLRSAKFTGANMRRVHLEAAALVDADFSGADLTGAYFNSSTVLDGVVFYNDKLGGACLADVSWGDANLAKIDWGLVRRLGDESVVDRCIVKFRNEHEPKARAELCEKAVRAYVNAIRANRQLSQELRQQGLTGVAARFAYQAYVLEKEKTEFEFHHDATYGWRKKIGLARSIGYAHVLSLVSGYGYRMRNTVVCYACLVAIFAFIFWVWAYLGGDKKLGLMQAITLSMNGFHGREFFQSSPISDIAGFGQGAMFVIAMESLLGLMLQAVFIASLTRRFVRG